LSFVARHPHLAPADHTIDAYTTWLMGLGIFIDEINDEAQIESLLCDHATICRLMGWPLPGDASPARQRAQAADAGHRVPAPVEPVHSTPLSDWAPDAQPDEPLIEVDHVSVAGVLPARRSIEAADAAEQFLEWVRLADRCGTYSDRELTELCAEFFEAEQITPIYDSVFRPALLALGEANVSKSRADTSQRVEGGRRDRSRKVRWTIHDADPTTISVPWSDLPRRGTASMAA
jgi:hypothetical protein